MPIVLIDRSFSYQSISSLFDAYDKVNCVGHYILTDSVVPSHFVNVAFRQPSKMHLKLRERVRELAQWLVTLLES